MSRQVDCRRCFEPNSLTVQQWLETVGIPTCSACGRTMLLGQRVPRNLNGGSFVQQADWQDLRSARRVPGLARGVRLYIRVIGDDDLIMARCADSTQVSRDQFGELHALYVEAGGRLGFEVSTLPPLFVDGDQQVEAYAVGLERFFLVVTSGLLDLMTPGEVVALLGHELGHILSGHTARLTALRGFRHLAEVAGSLTPTSIDGLLLPLIADPAVLTWVRACERIADRAGMLAAQAPIDMVTAAAKLAGAPNSSVACLDYDAFVGQAREYERLYGTSVRRRILTAKEVLNRRQPFPALRIADMVDLVATGGWVELLERVHDSSPGPWEQPCGQCGAHLAEWDRACRHCGLVIESPEADEDADDPLTDDEELESELSG